MLVSPCPTLLPRKQRLQPHTVSTVVREEPLATIGLSIAAGECGGVGGRRKALTLRRSIAGDADCATASISSGKVRHFIGTPARSTVARRLVARLLQSRRESGLCRRWRGVPDLRGNEAIVGPRSARLTDVGSPLCARAGSDVARRCGGRSRCLAWRAGPVAGACRDVRGPPPRQARRENGEITGAKRLDLDPDRFSA